MLLNVERDKSLNGKSVPKMYWNIGCICYQNTWEIYTSNRFVPSTTSWYQNHHAMEPSVIFSFSYFPFTISLDFFLSLCVSFAISRSLSFVLSARFAACIVYSFVRGFNSRSLNRFHMCDMRYCDMSTLILLLHFNTHQESGTKCQTNEKGKISIHLNMRKDEMRWDEMDTCEVPRSVKTEPTFQPFLSIATFLFCITLALSLSLSLAISFFICVVFFYLARRRFNMCYIYERTWWTLRQKLDSCTIEMIKWQIREVNRWKETRHFLQQSQIDANRTKRYWWNYGCRKLA